MDKKHYRLSNNCNVIIKHNRFLKTQYIVLIDDLYLSGENLAIVKMGYFFLLLKLKVFAILCKTNKAHGVCIENIVHREIARFVIGSQYIREYI